MRFITRGYNTISLAARNGTLIKTSTNPKLKDEVEYFKALDKIEDPYIKLLFPRLVTSETIADPYKLEMEFYPFRNLGDYITDTQYHGEEFWDGVLDMLFGVVKRMKRNVSALQQEEVKEHCYSMFIDKTLNEYTNLKNNFPFFSLLSKFETLHINGREYENFDSVWKAVQPQVDALVEECQSFNIIHGDLCFSNILLGANSQIDIKTLKLVDPRGSFGCKGIYGSSLYDFAKLLHSIEGGYEFFIYDRFDVQQSPLRDNEFTLKVHTTQNKETCKDLFVKRFEGSSKEFRKIKLIEGLIFIGMCARHYDSIDRQKAMYLTGVKILNEVLDENLC